MTTAEDEADVRTAAIADLTRINLDDLVLSFGWQDHPVLAGMARRLLRNSAQKFAHQITEFDTTHGSYIINGGGENIQGVELETRAIVAPGLQLTANYGYSRTPSNVTTSRRPLREAPPT